MLCPWDVNRKIVNRVNAEDMVKLLCLAALCVLLYLSENLPSCCGRNYVCEDGCNGICSNNEDEADGDRDSSSPLNNTATTGTSYARASAQQRMPRTKPVTTSRGGCYNYRHRSYYQQPHDSSQPLVTTEKKTFNEEEYTKITTPRQDVLFKKGYLGRKRPTAALSADTTANVNTSNINSDSTVVDVANGNLNMNGILDQNGETIENDQTPSSDVMSPVEEQPQYIYATNGYVDQTGGPPPGLYYINGSGYELYDPYSGNVTVVVGPAPHYGGPGAGPPVLAAVPCQPLPLQPLEWFNPAFLPYVTAPCHNGLATSKDRRKRYSTDSQNCSPQSSESTEPPGSPQECDIETTQPGEPPGPAMYTQAPAYVYPGYMFGPPMYNINGVTVQGAPTQPPPCDIIGSNKRRKKKRRRRRRRGGAEDGFSEESSSDEKELEEPMSVTSQESSSQEIESDSKQSTIITILNDSSSSSPLSSCQTLTPVDHTITRIPDSAESTSPADLGPQRSTFNSEISVKEVSPLVNSSLGKKENVSAPLVSKQNIKDTFSEHDKFNFNPIVKDKSEQSTQQFSQQVKQIKDNSEDFNSKQPLKDQTESEELTLSTSSPFNSLELKEFRELPAECQGSPSTLNVYHLTNDCTSKTQSVNDKTLASTAHSPERYSLENTTTLETKETEIALQCNGGIGFSLLNDIKPENSASCSKQKKSGKHKKNSKGKEEKQKRSKSFITNSNTDSNQKYGSKKKEDRKEVQGENLIADNCMTVNITSSANGIPSAISTEVEDIFTQEVENKNKLQKNTAKEFHALLNRFDEKSQISNLEDKVNLVTDMDGNEHHISEESMQSSSSSHVARKEKSLLFSEFKSLSGEPPTRPVRKEKQTLSVINFYTPVQDPTDISNKTAVSFKSLELPPISLRANVPKTEPKLMHEGSSSQLKDTADILESITAALTTEPTETKSIIISKDSPISQTSVKSQCEDSLLVGEVSKSPAAAHILEDKTSFCSKANKRALQDSSVESKTREHQCKSSNLFVLTSSQEESRVQNRFVELTHDKKYEGEVSPPIPPPRGRKLQACKYKLADETKTQEWDLECDNVTHESSGDSTTSSTTHESEDSVIELLSSTNTSPDDRPKLNLSSDEEDYIIFRGKKAQTKVEIMDIKSMPPDKSPSISGPSLQDSSQISEKDEPIKSKTPPTTAAKVQMSLNLPSYSPKETFPLECAELYADGLSKLIISEAISELSQKHMSMPITEAVTRWLRSQSPEVLSLLPPEDEMESEVSSEEWDSDIKAVEASKNQQHLTGQKNVYCNPLPAPLLEHCQYLLVNNDVNHSGDNDGTGRRVALIDYQHAKLKDENIISDKHENNIFTIPIPTTEIDGKLFIEQEFESCISSQKDNCVTLTSAINSNCVKHKYHSEIKKPFEKESELTQHPENCIYNVKYNNEHINISNINSENIPNGLHCNNAEMNTIEGKMSQRRHGSNNAHENSLWNTIQNVCEISEDSEKKVEFKHYEEPVVHNFKSSLIEDDKFSSTSEETLECEWDLWDCNPVKIPSKNPSPVEEILSKNTDNYCFQMCDPRVSVAKYYSLGSLQKKSMTFDEALSDSTHYSDEEVDALKHFQYELEENDDVLQTCAASSPSKRTGDLNVKLNKEIERNKIYGNPEIYKSRYGESGPTNNSGIQCEEEANIYEYMYKSTLSQRAQTAHLFHRKSSALVSRLKGDGPFPCGGICCILQ